MSFRFPGNKFKVLIYDNTSESLNGKPEEEVIFSGKQTSAQVQVTQKSAVIWVSFRGEL